MSPVPVSPHSATATSDIFAAMTRPSPTTLSGTTATSQTSTVQIPPHPMRRNANLSARPKIFNRLSYPSKHRRSFGSHSVVLTTAFFILLFLLSQFNSSRSVSSFDSRTPRFPPHLIQDAPEDDDAPVRVVDAGVIAHQISQENIPDTNSVTTSGVINTQLSKCSLSSQHSVLHESLRRGPDTAEISGRRSAKQPRDFDDVFATIDRRRYYFHPDRPAVQTVDALAAGLDTDLDDAVRVATAVVEKDVSARLTDVHVPVAYMRTTRQDGYQTIVNIGGRIATASGSQAVRRIVTLTRGYGHECEASFVRPTERVRIHVLLAYSSRPHRLAAFLKMFADYFAASHTNLVRIVVSTTEAEASMVRAVGRRHKELTDARFEVISNRGDENGRFSRAVAMREAAKLVPLGEVMFLADTDLVLGGNFLQNCRVNIVNGYQVWFPVMFSLYPHGKGLSSRDGIWRRSSYGMACMYRDDFDAVGGFGGNEERQFSGWGSEDVFLYNRFRDSEHYGVLRSVEPGLQHKWHGKDCERNEHYEACMRTVYMTVGSQDDLARLLSRANVDMSSLTKNAAPV